MFRRTFEFITNDGEGIFRILPPVGVIFMLPDDTFLIVQYIPCDAFAPGRTMLGVYIYEGSGDGWAYPALHVYP